MRAGQKTARFARGGKRLKSRARSAHSFASAQGESLTNERPIVSLRYPWSVLQMGVAKVAVLGSCWLVAVGLGLWTLFDYQTTAGAVSALSQTWPTGTAVPLDPEKPTLVMFVHPLCPCSRASLHELQVLVTHGGQQVRSVVVFSKPKGLSSDWTNTDLWKTARSTPGVTCLADAEGRETNLFHAQVSGEAMLYDRGGRLLFHGGLTVSRGHEGDNPGRLAIESLLGGDSLGLRETPVFGCRLQDRSVRSSSGRSANAAP